jgi:Tol biopolymer transport system component
VPAAPAHASFPPAQNGKIAFLKSGSDCLQLVNPDGTGQTEPGVCGISASDGLFRGNAALSPDGSRVVFAVYNAARDVFDRKNSKLDGTDPIVIPGFSYYVPIVAWSQDGKRISSVTWYTCAQLCGTLHVAFADGSGTERYLSDATPGSRVSWGSNGRIAYEFTFVEPVTSTRIDTAGPDGSPSFLTAGADPDWSPAADRIVFDQNGIAVINADGSGLHNLTSSDADFPPLWSPDGQKILFTSHRDGNDELYVMNPDGSGQTNLTSNPAADLNPIWSPDGSKIAFQSNRDGDSHIFVINRDGSGLVRVANDTGGDSLQDWQRIANRAPDCSGVAASRPVLTTANRRLAAITLDGASDPDGDPVTLSVDGVTQDEPVVSRGDRTSPDAIDEGEGELRVRAERNPRGDGRVYRIAFTASDGPSGSCSGTATVSVPRKRNKPAVDSAPPSYDSLIL